MQNLNFLEKKHRKLIEYTKRYAKKAYFKNTTSIACSLITKRDKIYRGINVKYRSVWKCICAERVAIAKAVEAKDTKLDIIVSVKYFPETDSYSVINMCGECLQIAIFYPKLKVIVDDKGALRVVPIEKVLPYPYK